jgi:hypothetical protein
MISLLLREYHRKREEGVRDSKPYPLNNVTIRNFVSGRGRDDTKFVRMTSGLA